VPFEHLNRRFIYLKFVKFFVGTETENDFKVTFDNVNYRFFEFIETAFWASQEVENEVAVLLNL